MQKPKECGLIRPTSSGFFSLLPLAQRSVEKLIHLIRRHIEAAGAQRITLPALTAESLWERTGRLDEVGVELMKMEDRHGKKYLLAPTHEEAIADLLADVGPISYKQLPLLLYQVSSKYRDERRPKHGLLRAREFLMLDAYAAHAHNPADSHNPTESNNPADSHNPAGSHAEPDVYARLTNAYAQIFQELQLPVYRVAAPAGDMGGSVSHEWQLRAAAGEDQIAVCPSCSHATLDTSGSGCGRCGKEMEIANSIEVGHTFVLGTRYSEPLRALVVPAAGSTRPLAMSCYGIGITRLFAAGVEALSSEKSLRWPEGIAPYSAIIIGPKEGSREWSQHGWEAVQRVYRAAAAVPALGGDVLLDDRHGLTIGKRLLMADRMGYPYIVVCGKSTLDPVPKYEVYRSEAHHATQPELLTLEELVDYLSQRTIRVNKAMHSVNL
ncbi:probable proline--tRNA ligase, mitochondrial isoform X2 [Galleria mellonella]|uniref:proline--tRNA ligase n=1 Tax=Galleria mellonella TaxID=7137 RepID=A0ABM3MH99_GALME|nr:probable proline--tRNA ligase, mitochondrial isoform X2 [Galleria mellonella]